MNWRSLLLNLFTFGLLLSFSFPTHAETDYTFSLGLFEPNDGIVNDVFDVGPIYSLRAGFMQEKGFSWLTGLEHYQLKTQVFTSKTEVALTVLDLGFQQFFFRDEEKRLATPFFGAGLSLVEVFEHSDSPSTKPISKTERTFGAYWEVGLEVPFFESSAFKVRLKDQMIRKDVLAETNLGSRALLIAYRYRY